MAEPMVGQDAVAFYLLSEQVSKHTKLFFLDKVLMKLLQATFGIQEWQRSMGMR